MKKKNNKENDKLFKNFSTAFASLMCLGALGAVTEIMPLGLSFCFIFSFIIFMMLMVSLFIYEGLVKKIIVSIYSIFALVVVIGLVLYILKIDFNSEKYKIEEMSISDANKIGFVIESKIEVNDDIPSIKLVKPFSYKIPDKSKEYYLQKVNNPRTIYFMFDNTLGLNVAYIGFYYLYIFSIILFFINMVYIVVTNALPSFKDFKKEIKKAKKSKK